MTTNIRKIAVGQFENIVHNPLIDNYIILNDSKGMSVSGRLNNDVISIDGFSENFRIRVEGRKVILRNAYDQESDITRIVFRMADNGTVKLQFVDGSLDLVRLPNGRIALESTNLVKTFTDLRINAIQSRIDADDAFDPSSDPVQQFTRDLDNLSGTSFNNLFVGSVSTSPEASTFTPGDMVDGIGDNNTLRLFMDGGTTADGVDVENIQTLDLRLTSSNAESTTNVVMTDWDSSLEQINIRSNKSSLVIAEQKTLADISISDDSTVARASSYSFGYTAGVLDGLSDDVSLTLNNVNGGVSSADITFDAGIERMAIVVADRAGAQYASDIDLLSTSTGNLQVTGGRVGQSFTIDADIQGGATFSSGNFLGDLTLTSGDIRYGTFGAGNDNVTITGWLDNTDASYSLGLGNNTFSGLGLGGTITGLGGNDDVTVAETFASASINLGAGSNDVTVTNGNAGTITLGSGSDDVDVGSNSGTINVGAGANTVDVTGTNSGTINGGSGDDYVEVNANTGAINVADGTNTVAVATDNSSSITGGSGQDTVTITGSAIAGSVINLGGGANSLTTTNLNGSYTGLDGSDSVTVNDEVNATGVINLGNGANSVNVLDDHLGSIIGGSGVDTINISDDVLGGSIVTNDGADTVNVYGDVINGQINVGGGNGNSINIEGSVSAAQPGTITFGAGTNNTLTIGGDLNHDDVVFGNGNGNSFTIEGNVINDANITIGNGNNVSGAVHGDLTLGSDITFGSGTGSLTIGSADSDGDYQGNSSLTASDDATVIDMGAGADQLTILAAGEDTISQIDVSPITVQSGAELKGGTGLDTLTLKAQEDATLIERTVNQELTIDYTGVTFVLGDVITVNFSRGNTSISVTYTVTEDDFIQGADNVPTKVAAGITAALNANSSFDAALTFGYEATSAAAVVTIESDYPLADFTFTSKRANVDVGIVDVVQISDAKINGFETVELVAEDGFGEDFDGNVTINADFALIADSTAINLDSKLELQETLNDENPKIAEYTSYQAGSVAIFEINDIDGEKITVSGHEVTATGNQKVELITVGLDENDHEAGDIIRVTLGDVVVEYVVTTANLASDTAEADAINIATGLMTAVQQAITNNNLNLTVERNDNVITVIGPRGEDYDLTVEHVREGIFTSVSDEGQDFWNVRDDMSDIQEGDTITITVDGQDYEYVVTREDCVRLDADAIVKYFASTIPGATASWGTLVLEDFDYTVTRPVNLIENSQHQQTARYTQLQATDTDDETVDVYIYGDAAAGSSTTMDLTIDGYGDFDLSIADGSGFDALSLTLGDEFSHYINTNGDGGSGNFANSITVTVANGVNTDNQAIHLDNVLAKTVNTSASPADFLIDQYYSVRENSVTPNEVINVTTGAGDDHLITHAVSAGNQGSSINLGTGVNTLSLGWGSDYYANSNGNSTESLNSADIQAIGNINFTGSLSELNLLADIELTGDTTLRMPGGVGNVETLTWQDLRTSANADYDLTIRGAANNFSIISEYAVQLGDNDGVPGTLTVQNAAGNEITGDLSIVAGDDNSNANVYLNLGNNTLESLYVYADEEIDIVIADNSDATFNIGSVSLETDDYDLTFGVVQNLNSSVTIGDVDMLASVDDYTHGAELNIADNTDSTVTFGDLSIISEYSYYYDAQSTININSNSDTDVTIASVDAYGYDYAILDIYDNIDNSSVTITGDISLEADDEDAELYINDNTHTNVSLSENGTITMKSCDEDTQLYIERNVNAHDPFSNGPDQTELLSKSYEINLGNVVMDADETTFITIEDNSDDTYFGDLSINIGNIEMFTYRNATLNIGDDDGGGEGTTGNLATTINVGDVDILAENDVEIDLDNNSGRLYTTSFGPEERREIDFVDVTVGNINAVSTSDDVDFYIYANTQANISVGNVSMTADDDVTLEIDSNDTSDTDTLSSVTIDIGTVDQTSNGSASLVIEYNDAYFDSNLNEIDVTESFTDIDHSLEVNVSDVTVNAYGYTDFVIYDNDADADAYVDADDSSILNSDADMSVSITVGNVEIHSSDDVDFYIDDNDARVQAGVYSASDSSAFISNSTATMEVTVGNVEISSSDDGVDFHIEDNEANTEIDITDGYDTYTSLYGEGEDGVFGEDLGEDVEPSASNTITVGNVDIDAYEYINFEIDDNDTDTGVYAESSYQSVGLMTEASSLLDITVGNVDLSTSDGNGDVDFRIINNDTESYTYISSYNSGNINVVSLGFGLHAESNIDVGTVNIDSGSDVTFDINDNDAYIHLINFGSDSAALQLDSSSTNTINVDKIDVSAYGYVDFNIADNDSNIDVHGEDEYGAFSALSDSDTTDIDASVSITLQDVDLNSLYGNTTFSIVDNDSYMLADSFTGNGFNGQGEDSGSGIDAVNIETDISIGHVDIDSGSDATFEILDNDAYIDADAYGEDADVLVSDSSTDVHITIDGIDITASDDADFNIQDNDAYIVGEDNGGPGYGEDGAYISDSEVSVVIDISDVTIDALSDVNFNISDNDADVDLYYYRGEGNSASVEINISDVDIDAGDNVHFDIYDNIAGSDSTVDITVRDITIDAGNDVHFYVDGWGSTETSIGDVIINAGLDSDGATSEWSDVYVYLDEVTYSGDTGSQSVTISADSHSDGDGDIYGEFNDVYDLRDVSVSGTNAELYFTGDIGSDDSGVFTLDLSGMTGEFGEDADDYNPTGQNASIEEADQIDDGVYVETWDANFGLTASDDIVVVKIGSSDLIYNAYHSSFDNSDDTNDWGDHWDADEEGWYSLGNGGDFTPEAQVQTIDLDGDNEWRNGDQNTLSIDYGNVTYTWTIGTGQGELNADGTNSLEIGSTGLYISLSSDDSFTITGTPDGASFVSISQYDAWIDSANDNGDDNDVRVTSGASSIDPADPAEDNHGQVARETFQFTGDSVGEIVIGGFRPGDWGQSTNPDGRYSDRLDFSKFDWNGNGVADDAGLVDLNYFSFEIDDTDGFFKDVIIDFIGGGNNTVINPSDFGTIRLVGVGELDDAIDLVRDSMLFA